MHGSVIFFESSYISSLFQVDQAALTGESLPVTFYKGGSCKMGSNVVRGEVEGTVEFTGSETFFGKTASMLQGECVTTSQIIFHSSCRQFSSNISSLNYHISL